MTDMHKSLLVTIRPHITPERAVVLIETICDKLWPGAAGGAQWITRGQIKDDLALALTQVKQYNKAVQFRVIRDGARSRLEPIVVDLTQQKANQ